MINATYLGIVRNGASLLTSFQFSDAKTEVAAHREAERSLYGWLAVFPGDTLSIERLSKRSKDGWEIARP